ncbi:MAG: RNA methyltransferase [Mangrovibacterium sp.]|nr:RNA methyltransferase [Mangrovibacterium sp.]
MNKELVQYLSTFITPGRLEVFDRILKQRTRYLTVVLEDIYQPQNASAVIRTADCFGIQDLYVIENNNLFTIDKEVALGASKWVDIRKFNTKGNSTGRAVVYLRKKGYRIVATSPHEGDVNLEDYDLAKGKTALFFGTELSGVSDLVRSEADEFLKIPMYGFTESLNISVSAGIILQELTHRMRLHPEVDWLLTPAEQEEVKLSWLRRSIKMASLIEGRFLKSK